MTFNLGPPPEPKDSRFLEWVTLLWKYVKNAPGTGTVTAITAGTGLSGGTITDTGTIAIATGGVNLTMLSSDIFAFAAAQG